MSDRRKYSDSRSPHGYSGRRRDDFGHRHSHRPSDMHRRSENEYNNHKRSEKDKMPKSGSLTRTPRSHHSQSEKKSSRKNTTQQADRYVGKTSEIPKGSKKSTNDNKSEKSRESTNSRHKYTKDSNSKSEKLRQSSSSHHTSSVKGSANKESKSKDSRGSHTVSKQNDRTSQKRESQGRKALSQEKTNEKNIHESKSKMDNKANYQRQRRTQISFVHEKKQVSRESTYPYTQPAYKRYYRGRRRGIGRLQDDWHRGDNRSNLDLSHSRQDTGPRWLTRDAQETFPDDLYKEKKYWERFGDLKDAENFERSNEYYSLRSDSLKGDLANNHTACYSKDTYDQNDYGREESFHVETELREHFEINSRRNEDDHHINRKHEGRYDRTSSRKDSVTPIDINQERQYYYSRWESKEKNSKMLDHYADSQIDSNNRQSDELFETNEYENRFEDRRVYDKQSVIENDSQRYLYQGNRDFTHSAYENAYSEQHYKQEIEHRHIATEYSESRNFKQRDRRSNIQKSSRFNRHKQNTSKRGYRAVYQRHTGQNINKGQILQSSSQQHYRNTKRKFLLAPFQRRNIGQSRNSTKRANRGGVVQNNRNINQHNNRNHVSESRTGVEGKIEKAVTESEKGQPSERPKANPVFDRGESGCLLKEDRPYEDRQKEGFLIHMDPPKDQGTSSKVLKGDDKNIDQMQQPIMFIPNQDLQQGPRQVIDQFGSMINLPEIPEGGLAPISFNNPDGQELIFIPFGNNTSLPENIVPVQQSNLQFGFLPQFVPNDQVSQQPEAIGAKLDQKSENKPISEGSNIIGKGKPLTLQQRAKIRSKLMLRRKQQLVKEVEKKVIENFLDRTKSFETKSKDSKASNSKNSHRQGSAINEGVSPQKIAKKDHETDHIYEDVSDLEDVSDEEMDQLSDWENVSVDEIELDANERRAKFRKQNEPRTYIQHSATKRKLNVRKASSKSFKTDKNDSKPKTEQKVRNEKPQFKEMGMGSEQHTGPHRDKTFSSKNSISETYTNVYNERTLDTPTEKDTSGNKQMFRSYTASRVSQELKLRENENKFQGKQKTSYINDRIGSNDSSRRSNIFETRPISPLQVTVKNNLYEKREIASGKDVGSDKGNQFKREHDREGQSRDSKIPQMHTDSNENNFQRSRLGPSIRDSTLRNRNYDGDMEDDRVGFERKTEFDKRIIREKGMSQPPEIHEEKERETYYKTIQREEMIHSRNDTEKSKVRPGQKEPQYRKDEWRTNEKTTAIDARKGEGIKLLDQQHQHSFNEGDRDENSRLRPKMYHGYKPAMKYREERRDSKADAANRREEDILHSNRGEKDGHVRHTKSKATSNLDEHQQARMMYFEPPQKRGSFFAEEDDFSDEKDMTDSDDEEQHINTRLFKNNKPVGFSNTAAASFFVNNLPLIARTDNDDEIFDPSLPPVQNISSMSAPSQPPLPDMSLPPPQFMTAQFAESPQVFLQNQPVLNQQSQIQQQQVLGMQQSPQLHSVQSRQNSQQRTITFQPQLGNQQSSFQQSNINQANVSVQRQPFDQHLQGQAQNSSQPQQRSYQVLIDHSQPLTRQLTLNPRQNTSAQQQISIQQPQSGSVLSYTSQSQNVNQNNPQPQSQMLTNSNPFQNVQQTLTTLGINQGVRMPARIVGVGQGQNVIQGQVAGQPQARGYLVPAALAGSLQNSNKFQ